MARKKAYLLFVFGWDIQKIVPCDPQNGFSHPNLKLMIYSYVTVLFEKCLSMILAVLCDFQQCGILTNGDLDEPA